MMHHYAQDLSYFDFGFDYSDPITYPFSHRRSSSNSTYDYFEDDFDDRRSDYGDRNSNTVRSQRSPPKHRHDGASPLPLGMDWSLPPRKWDGRDSLWPHDPHTGWSYCVTVPSWVMVPNSRGSAPVVFYRVQVGIQSPEGITTTRVILRRFNDFLELYSEIKKEFPKKNLPPAPPKRMLRIKNQTLLEDRRCSLEDWMEKLLSDIDISRSAPVAIFLELEAAARSSFYDKNQQVDVNSSTIGAVAQGLLQASSDININAGGSSIASNYGSDTPYEVSELGTPRQNNDQFGDPDVDNPTSEQHVADSNESSIYSTYDRGLIVDGQQKYSGHGIHRETDSSVTDMVAESTPDVKALRLDGTEFFSERENSKLDGHVQRLSAESIKGDFISQNLLIALPSDVRNKLNRVLSVLQQRLSTAKTDVEDLIARLNQEMAVRQFLTTKVKDLEVELETTQLNCRENMQQAVLTEKEKFTQMQWDMEELRRKCLEMELKFRSEEEGRVEAETTKASIIEENKMLIKQLDVAREQLDNLQKYHDEFEFKSKADVKMLIKEIKSLRSSQSELKQEFSQLLKEKIEVERILHKERQRMEQSHNANAKLLHECTILRNRLQECSVDFLVEEEDKLIVDTSSPSDALDLLTTSENRIGLLLAEAQLLAQDVENAVSSTAEEASNVNAADKRKGECELRKMLADIFVDNARLTKQVNSVIRRALNENLKSEKDDEEEEEEINLRKTVLSKFLER